MSDLTEVAKTILSDVALFSRYVLGMPLYDYQLRPLWAIVESVLRQEGEEFLLLFPRQSGKNEAVAHLLVYLLNLLQRRGGNIVYAAVGDGIGRGILRLEERLENRWNLGRWRKEARPTRRALGQAAVVFLSAHPSASARGETAHWLIVVDELQDREPAHLEATLTPMRAAYNATAVYLGTARLTSDALWRKKAQLEERERQDGRRRVYRVGPDEVTAENPLYRSFLERQVESYGRAHPIIASEYFLEPLDGDGGLFDARRRALMRGNHPRLRAPIPGHTYVATLDVAGQDEAATNPVARLDNPGRDYTVATIFEVQPLGRSNVPTFYAVDVFVDHGSRHFEDAPGRPRLADRLAAYLAHWGVIHVVADASGVGQGLVSWLAEALGRGRVTAFDFAGPGKKAMLGSRFLSLVETGRFKYWSEDEATPGSDGWWYWQQCAACSYTLPLGGQFERDLRWGVPPGHRTSTPAGSEATHDDRLLSAALVAEMDRLLAAGQIRVGLADSVIIEPEDPLEGLAW